MATVVGSLPPYGDLDWVTGSLLLNGSAQASVDIWKVNQQKGVLLLSCYLSIKIYKLLEKNKRPVCEELIIQLGRGHSGKANRSENALSGCWKWGSSSTSGKPPTSRTSGLIRTTTRVRSMMKYVSQNQLRPQVRLVTRCHNDAVVPLASWQQLHPKSEAAVAVWYGLHHP